MKSKQKQSRAGRVTLILLLIAAIGVGSFAGYQIYEELHQYKQSSDLYEKLKDDIVTENDEEGPQIDWNSLLAINGDIAAWIRQPDTVIDYPVVFTDDNTWYLRHTIENKYDLFGTLFVDSTNSRDWSDWNTVIYGHHFSGSYGDVMFTSLDNYQNQSYYDEHKYLDLYTPTTIYKLYPIAGVVKSGSEQYIRTSFADMDDYYRYIADLINESTFTSSETFSAADQVVMLCSCTDIIDNGRYALICKLVKVSDKNGN